MSSEAPPKLMVMAASWIISPACGPMMWTPSTLSVAASARTYTNPSVSWLILARLLATKGNLPFLYWTPEAFS